MEQNNTFRNYMVDNKVFILDEINSINCAYLIGDLTNFVFNEQNINKKIMIIINSPGGEIDVLFTILGLLNIARLSNIEIYTFVLGRACSAASILAVQGDYRYMSKLSKHFIHFGSIYDVTQKRSEIEKIYTQNKEYTDMIDELYISKSNNKLNKEFLEKIQNDERGYLNANRCLKLGLCDAIVESDLLSKLKYEQDQLAFEKEFAAWNKKKNNKK